MTSCNPSIDTLAPFLSFLGGTGSEPRSSLSMEARVSTEGRCSKDRMSGSIFRRPLPLVGSLCLRWRRLLVLSGGNTAKSRSDRVLADGVSDAVRLLMRPSRSMSWRSLLFDGRWYPARVGCRPGMDASAAGLEIATPRETAISGGVDGKSTLLETPTPGLVACSFISRTSSCRLRRKGSPDGPQAWSGSRFTARMGGCTGSAGGPSRPLNDLLRSRTSGRFCRFNSLVSLTRKACLTQALAHLAEESARHSAESPL